MSKVKEMENKNIEVKENEPENTRNDITYKPNVDIYETGKDINIVSELPGVEEKDLEIMLENSVLTISGKMKVENYPDYELIYSEYQPLKYERTFRLSNEYDNNKMVATLKNGLLHINIPKSEKQLAKKIKVNIA